MRESKRLRETLGSVGIAAMNGDNLAITLCSAFCDGGPEDDETGWSEAATRGYEEACDAIHAHYAPTIDRLTAENAAVQRAARDAARGAGGGAAWLRTVAIVKRIAAPSGIGG